MWSLKRYKGVGRYIPAFRSLIVFASVFLYFTHPIRLGDFWWHLNTGRWIVENRELPSSDPFTFTGATDAAARSSIILKGYWLSQVLYFLAYKAWGFSGLIIGKAFLFTAIFYVLFTVMRTRGLNYYIALMAVVPLVPLAREFEEVRPQVFSFLFTLLVYHVIEKMLYALRGRNRINGTTLISLPVLMLIWANLHPGFIVGYAVIGIHAFAETAKYMLNKDAMEGPSYKKFMLWICSSVAVSLLNPGFHRVLDVSIKNLFSNPSVRFIDEYRPPWEYAAYVNDASLLYGLAAFTLITLVILAVSYKQVTLTDFLLYCGFLFAATGSFRFCIFFILTASVITAKYWARALERIGDKYLKSVSIAITLIFATLVSSHASGKSFLALGEIEKVFLPENAATFIKNYKLPPPLFNPYEWGAYLSFRLYPQYKVFIDARALNPDIYKLYKAAKNGEKSTAFQKYGIKTVVFYPIFPLNNILPDIIPSLLSDKNWNLVYFNNNSVVLVRRDAMPAIPVIGKELLWDSLINFFEAEIRLDPGAAGPYIRLGKLYYIKGETQKAARLLKKALKRDPGHKKALWRLN